MKIVIAVSKSSANFMGSSCSAWNLAENTKTLRSLNSGNSSFLDICAGITFSDLANFINYSALRWFKNIFLQLMTNESEWIFGCVIHTVYSIDCIRGQVECLVSQREYKLVSKFYCSAPPTHIPTMTWCYLVDNTMIRCSEAGKYLGPSFQICYFFVPPTNSEHPLVTTQYDTEQWSAGK